MADLTPTEQTFTQKLGTALFTLLAFLGITSITEVLTALKAAADSFDFSQKPTLANVGDTLLDCLNEGGQFITNAPEQTTYLKWIGIIKGGWDAIAGGASSIVAFFDGMIAGHKAKIAAEKAQEETAK